LLIEVLAEMVRRSLLKLTQAKTAHQQAEAALRPDNIREATSNTGSSGAKRPNSGTDAGEDGGRNEYDGLDLRFGHPSSIYRLAEQLSLVSEYDKWRFIK
jgi:hypothetical protein